MLSLYFIPSGLFFGIYQLDSLLSRSSYEGRARWGVASTRHAVQGRLRYGRPCIAPYRQRCSAQVIGHSYPGEDVYGGRILAMNHFVREVVSP